MLLSTRTTTILLGLTATALASKLFYDYVVRDTVKSHQQREKKKQLPPLELRHTIEICLADIESAKNAIKGGANSIELCADRPEGGTTPSIGLIEECVKLCKQFNVQVHVLIRPRAGDFVYSREEFDVIQRDIIAAKNAGVDGIVVGVLTTEGKIDKKRMSIIRTLAKDLQLTFHRAFDLCAHYETAIEDIIHLGCDRLLTSGLEKHAITSANKKLKQIVAICHDRIHVVAAAGINAINVEQIIKGSNCPGVHIGNAVNKTILTNIIIESTLETPLFTMSAEMKVWKCTHAELVQEIVDKANSCWEGEVAIDW